MPGTDVAHGATSSCLTSTPSATKASCDRPHSPSPLELTCLLGTLARWCSSPVAPLCTLLAHLRCNTLDATTSALRPWIAAATR
eukprot:2986581-Rhodomonas_salina.2